MRLSRMLLVGLSVLPLAGISSVYADTPVSSTTVAQSESIFDPSRYMRVAEIKEGMKGYGISVFHGTTLEKFNVEVVSILKDFNPKYDVILIRCGGANLEHTGAIAGMSGSPVYLYDDAGKARMIGAFAYGWPLQKDPIAGVQPIEYMLKLPVGNAPATTQPNDNSGGSPESSNESPVRQARWALGESVLLPGMKVAPANYPLAEWGKFTPNPRLLAAGNDETKLTPLATPLMTAGLSPRVLEEMEPVFRAYGLIPLQAGGGKAVDDNLDPKIEPGSVLAVPLLEGDVDMSAVGTCTDVIGDHMLAFGHPFNNEGPISLPFGSGSVQGIIANYMTSFKLGSLAKVRGTLTTDQAVGVAGILGQVPPTVPIDIRIQYTDGSEDQMYHFTAALHPKFTPLIAAAALTAALSGNKELPQYHTVDYDLVLEFSNGKTVHVVNTSVNASAADLFFEVGTPLIAASENPFARVMIKKITGTMRVTPQALNAEILYANVPRSRYQPGETVTAYVAYRPFRAGEMVLPVTLDLPRDLPDGTYQFTISDWQKYLQDEQIAEPFKFTAETIDQVFDVLRDVSAVRHDAVYVRLLRQPDGVAIGHTAMPRLPSSLRQIMIGAGRSDTTEFVSSSLKVVPTSWVMEGSADFEITIDHNANTDMSIPTRPPHRDVQPTGKATPAEPAKAGTKSEQPGI